MKTFTNEDIVYFELYTPCLDPANDIVEYVSILAGKACVSFLLTTLKGVCSISELVVKHSILFGALLLLLPPTGATAVPVDAPAPEGFYNLAELDRFCLQFNSLMFILMIYSG